MLGVTATVLEKDHVGRHASGVNAGGVRRLGRNVAEIPLSIESMDLWHSIKELVDDDCDFQSHGQVKVAESDAELEILVRRVGELRSLGFTHEEVIDREELHRLTPAIAPHCVGGIISRRDGAANPFRTTVAFKRKAEQFGVRFQERTVSIGLKRAGRTWRIATNTGTTYEAPVVVNCAGAWAGRVASWLGEPVPLDPLALMMMVSNRLPHFLDPVVMAAGRTLSFKQLSNGTLVIGGGYLGTYDLETNNTSLNFSRLARSAQTVCDLFPIMRSAQIVRCWAGIEARMPDEIPVIGPSSTSEDAFHAFGFSGHGFQLAPIVGRIIAHMIAKKQTTIPLQAFRIDRFVGYERAVTRATGDALEPSIRL